MDLSDAQIERYSRQILLKELGGTGQERILGGRVLILGDGTVPAITALYLAAAGVGQLGLGLDHGADETAETIRALNPDVGTEIILPDSASREVIGHYDLMTHMVVSGKVDHRLNQAWLAAARPMVVGCLTGDTAAVTVLHPGRRAGCLACLRWPQRTAPTTPLVAPLAGTVASLQAIEVLKVLSDLGDLLWGRLATVDAAASHYTVAELPRSSPCKTCGAT
jgi:molybdopterin/thiamine biosynthesis adenylyltransferase